MDKNKTDGIWLEVSEVQFESGGEEGCCVLLKADREQPPLRWPVEPNAIKPGGNSFDNYKEILGQIDKKRAVLARLSWMPGKGSATEKGKGSLHCTAFRFQSPELGR